MIWTLKKCNKKVESLCLFTHQRGVKMGYFYWLCVKNSNHFHEELSLGYLKDVKFYLESKASFIDIRRIASFKLFLIAWLWEYRTFSDSCGYLEALALAKIHPVGNFFPKINRFPLSNLFSSSNMFFIRLSLAHTWKNFWGHRARLREKENLFRCQAFFERNLLCFACARANHAKIVCSRDAQCNTKELP